MRHSVPIKRIQIECFAETAFAQGYNYSVSDCSTRALLNFLLIFKRSGGNATRDVLLTAHIPPTRACFLAMCDILFFQVAAQSCCNSSQTQKKNEPLPAGGVIRSVSPPNTSAWHGLALAWLVPLNSTRGARFYRLSRPVILTGEHFHLTQQYLQFRKHLP